MANKDQLLVFLIDALSYAYLESMPFLRSLASREGGRAYSVRPAAGFRGVEPILNGEWTAPGETPFRFRTPPDDTRFPPLLGMGDSLLPTSWNRVWRLLLSRGTKTTYPHLVPPNLLRRLGCSKGGPARVPKAIEQWEREGRRVWWYTRDSKVEAKKALTARVYRALFRDKMLREAHEALGRGDDVVYLEFSTLPDAVGHRDGPRAESAHRAAALVDRQLQDWVEAAGGLHPGLSVAVISDHGMSEVNRETDLEATLKKKGWINGIEYVAVWNSNFAQVWIEPSKTEAFLSEVETVENVRPVTEEERRTWFGLDASFGDLILACEEGTVFSPNHFQGKKKVRGMHGYLGARSEESRALCLFSGPVFEPLDQERVDMPELHPVLAGWAG